MATSKTPAAPVHLYSGRRITYALAAAVALLVAVGAWLFVPILESERAAQDDSHGGRRALALSINGRSADLAASLIVPAGGNVIALTLQGERPRDATEMRVVVRSVNGKDVWAGAADAESRGGIAAHVEIPAGRLSPDDYIVTLLATVGGREREVEQYSLRVRSR